MTTSRRLGPPPAPSTELPFQEIQPQPFHRLGRSRLVAIPSNEMVQYSPETTTTTSTTAVKLKEIVITVPGSYRVMFTIVGSSNTNFNFFGQVYRNGSVYGQLEVWTPSATLAPEKKVADLGGWGTGELCQLYGYASTGTLTLSAFGLWAEYDLKPPKIPAGNINLK